MYCFLAQHKTFWIWNGNKFDKGPLAVEQNNCLKKIVNVNIVYDLDAWAINPTNNFKFKNYLFGATNVVKTSDKKSICIVAKE